ncbi:MAG: substrate-binding domain-containing protein [Nocardioides sp.]|uniref:sugar ABC transporter substrate-binding protein n=1 Tax=Nocardioides sp. TaxID=35761 RepID=UPI0039E2A1CA
MTTPLKRSAKRSLRRPAALGFALLIGAGALAACGSSDDDSSSGSGGSSDSSSSSGSISAACSLDNPPTSSASAPSIADLGTASGKVGVILPDTTSSTRYTQFDKPLLQKYLTKAGLTPDIQNAGGDTAKFAQIAQSMIGSGVKVLIIDSIDASSGAGVEKLAAKNGVKVIDYDRVNLGGTANYYVSFDNEEVGKLQAQAMVDCLDAQNVSDPNIIMMDGGTDTDNNAVLFKKGAHEVLDPLAKAGKLTITAEATVKGWDVTQAASDFQQALTSAGGTVDGVLAANDDIANAVVGALKGQGLDGHVVVTGQDSTVVGLQNIVNGLQSMTIFKSYEQEAQAATLLATALVSGKDPADAGLTLTKFDDPDSASHKIQALLLPPQVITQANLSTVVDSGQTTQAEICKGITDACAKVGLN